MGCSGLKGLIDKKYYACNAANVYCNANVLFNNKIIAIDFNNFLFKEGWNRIL